MLEVPLERAGTMELEALASELKAANARSLALEQQLAQSQQLSNWQRQQLVQEAAQPAPPHAPHAPQAPPSQPLTPSGVTFESEAGGAAHGGGVPGGALSLPPVAEAPNQQGGFGRPRHSRPAPQLR
jgi:hypothetical protein